MNINFAFQVQDVDSFLYKGQTFNIDFGSVEQATNITEIIDDMAVNPRPN